MTKHGSSTAPRRGAAGINLAITAASLSATLGGWALLTLNDRTVTEAVAATPPAIVQPLAAGPPAPALAPLPTVVPRRSFPRQQPRAVQPAPIQGAAQRTAPPQRVAPAPPPASVPAPPPPPIANTQSSR